MDVVWFYCVRRERSGRAGASNSPSNGPRQSERFWRSSDDCDSRQLIQTMVGTEIKSAESSPDLSQRAAAGLQQPPDRKLGASVAGSSRIWIHCKTLCGGLLSAELDGTSEGRSGSDKPGREPLSSLPPARAHLGPRGQIDLSVVVVVVVVAGNRSGERR